MHEITVQGQRDKSRILIGERLENLPRYLPNGRTIIITDEVVAKLYQGLFPPADIITIGCGEKNKTLDTLAQIYDRLIGLEADRSTFIVGIGGGIVGDVCGFAASTYMRGLRFGFVPTSLLAQVDATVGGKNGVNFKGFKNMVGVFNQPEFVIADINLLKTLPEKEIACGLAEIVKHGCIADADYFSCIESNIDAIKTRSPEVMLKLVHGSVTIKANIVNQDEREAGERRKLNFGHTFGHAFEKTAGVTHGEAVSMGMLMAAAFSLHKKLLTQKQFNRIKSLLERLNLPVKTAWNENAVFEALKKDKKRSHDILHFVFLEEIGKSTVKSLAIEELKSWLHQIQ
ncbi:MAG: 3-dehydroquinate synthase [Desulfobacteraceae bacterium]|nr:3-dehydroquinate synthase [Desulfobacteraceae bacterium]